MSDNELDAELLGMVGGESDDEGEELEQTQHIDDRSPSQEAKPSVEKAEEPPKRTKGIAQKVRGRRKKARKQESEDEDDLDLGGRNMGAITDGYRIRLPSADSLGSGAMEESDGEVDAHGSPGGEDAPLFPIEGKYISARDRDDILDMPEIQREEILADRAAQVLKRQQDLQLRKALAAASTAANKHKRKAAAAELEDGGRRNTRPKAEKPRSALDDYKRARELKGTDRGRLDSGRDRRDERSQSSRGSDRDADGESEVEWAEPSSDLRSGREEAPAELRDFERCRIGRSNFAKICFFPGFDDAIKGCFARVSIGMNRETGQNMYRMTQIKGFTEGKPYQMESSNGKHFTTDQYALVAHGVAEKPWPFSACSDSKFTDQEFDRYVTTMKKENQRVPKKTYLEARLQDIHKLLNTEWTDELLSKKFANQRAMERKHDPANAARLKREKIVKRKMEAEEGGDAEEIMRCDAELAALENSSHSITNGSNGFKGSSAKKDFAAATVPARQQDRLAALNQKNRGKNAEEVRKALLEEKRKLQAAREQAVAEAKAKAANEAAKKKAEEDAKLLAVPKNDMSDLFGEGSDISRAGTPVNGAVRSPGKRSRAGTPLGGLRKERSGLGKVVGAIKKKSLDDDVIGSLDLGIDVEI
ncbi:hypothetical protein LTR85_005985 [Meristemomyces frigidus]|nr:hypothetical protein LTR85_005985 [Meristemomyces frigidus]